MIAKPATIAPAVTEPSDRLLTGVCSVCGLEDPFTHAGSCPRCGARIDARDDTPPTSIDVPTWQAIVEAAVRAEDEADERKEWRDDTWTTGSEGRGGGW